MLCRFHQRQRAVMCVCVFAFSVLVGFNFQTPAQQKRRAANLVSRKALVIDERLAVVREDAGFDARFVQRLGRGREVQIINSKNADGILFYRVAVTRRTRGFIQAEALATMMRPDDDRRVLRLIEASQEFERLTRAKIFLEAFPRSPNRARVLMLFGDEAERAAIKLTADAARRLKDDEIAASGAPRASYFANFNGLDRYQRLGVKFTFDRQANNFRYDGAAWREIIKRHPLSEEAKIAGAKLSLISARRE